MRWRIVASVICLFLLVFWVFAQDMDEEDFELFEDPEEEIGVVEEPEEIFFDEEELDLFEEEDPGDLLEAESDVISPEKESRKKANFMEQFFANKSGSTKTGFYFYYRELDMEENASPEPDKKRHVFQQHSVFSTFISQSIWRLDLTSWIDIGNQKDTYVPAYLDLQNQDWQDWFQDPRRERRFFKISELYLSLFLPVCDIFLGKKDFDNSLSSLYSPADIYRAVDSNEPFSTNSFGMYLLEGDFFIDTTTLSLVIFPVYQGDKGFSPISRWGYYKFKEIQDEEGTTAEDLEDSDDGTRHYTDITWENISYLMRIKTTLWGTDMFLSGFYGLAGNTVSRLITDPDTSEEEKEAEVVPVVNATCGFSTTVDKFEFHGEGLYNYTLESKDDDYLRYVAGGRCIFDGFPQALPLDRIELTLEYAGEVLFKEQSNEGYADSTGDRRGFKNDLLASLLFQFSEKLKLFALGQYNFNETSLMVIWKTEYQWLGNLALEAGTQYFYAPEGSDLYYWRHNNRLLLGINYTY